MKLDGLQQQPLISTPLLKISTFSENVVCDLDL